MSRRNPPPLVEPKNLDRKLAYLLDDVDMLAETLAEWREVSETEQDIWLFEWSNHLAILRGLSRAHEGTYGDMSAEQERRYEELLDKLRSLGPAMEGTGLFRA